MMTRIAWVLALLASIILVATGCKTTEDGVAQLNTAMSESVEAEVNDTKSMKMKIGETEVDVIWEENGSVEELMGLAASGLTISMSMYGGFEQVGPIGKHISRDDKQMTTSAGDIVLYSGNQLVVFYGSNSWTYTRLGKISLPEQKLKELLGNGDVTITLRAE